MKKGFIIYALGHSNYYRMAEALAASLIVNGSRDSGIGIALLCDNESNITERSLFDKVLRLKDAQFKVDGKIVFNNATVLAYQLSPFDTTIKLDADMIWLTGKPVAEIFQSLESVDIAFSNMGHGWGKGNSVWADEAEIKKAYKLTGEEKLYKIYGEFLYFKKCDAIKDYFDKVQRIYKERKVKCSEFSNGQFTDELAFQIACMQTGIYPHKDEYTPVYNTFLDKPLLSRKWAYELAEIGYYGYSIGGNVSAEWSKRNYDNLALHYYNTLGLLNPYQVSNKRSFLPERKKL